MTFFTLTNYTGGAFRDQLERGELFSAQSKAPVKQNELTACWSVTLVSRENKKDSPLGTAIFRHN